MRLALRNVIATNMEREEKFTPLKLSLYGNLIFNMACQGTVTESGKQDERFIEQVNIFRKIYIQSLMNMNISQVKLIAYSEAKIKNLRNRR